MKYSTLFLTLSCLALSFISTVSTPVRTSFTSSNVIDNLFNSLFDVVRADNGDREMEPMTTDVEPSPTEMMPTETPEMMMTRERILTEEGSEDWIEQTMKELKKPDEIEYTDRQMGEDYASESPGVDMLESPEPSMEASMMDGIFRQDIVPPGPRLPVLIESNSIENEDIDEEPTMSESPMVSPSSEYVM